MLLSSKNEQNKPTVRKNVVLNSILRVIANDHSKSSTYFTELVSYGTDRNTLKNTPSQYRQTIWKLTNEEDFAQYVWRIKWLTLLAKNELKSLKGMKKEKYRKEIEEAIRKFETEVYVCLPEWRKQHLYLKRFVSKDFVKTAENGSQRFPGTTRLGGFFF